MSDDHSARAGSLNAHLTSVVMEIDDDDEDIIQVVVDVINESSIPIGGLQAVVVDSNGQRHEAAEGISSIGPGLTRQFKFEARIQSGTWSFEFNGAQLQWPPHSHPKAFAPHLFQGENVRLNI